MQQTPAEYIQSYVHALQSLPLKISYSRAQPAYSNPPGYVAAVSHFAVSGQTQWYPPPLVGADMLAHALFDGDYVQSARILMSSLTPDDYTSFLVSYYNSGLERFGAKWRYADIVTVLLCLSQYLRPSHYIEIGVRRGRSAAAVASVSPNCSLTLFDIWTQDYAGMLNPGPTFVREELQRVGHVGEVAFIDGDSHVTLPEFFRVHPDASFDLITVDGDHTSDGAALDLLMVLPRLRIGGAVVFDDISHPLHPELAGLWQDMVVSQARFSSFSFLDVGYGVGFGIRKY